MSLFEKLGFTIAGLLVALLLGFNLGYTYRENKSEEAMLVHLEKDKKIELARLEELKKLDQKYRTEELNHEKRVAGIYADFQVQQKMDKARNDKFVSDLLDGSKRLRIRVAACDAGATKGKEIESSSAGVNETRVVELTTEDSTTLWRIGEDGDRAIEKLTALQEWAKSAVALCGGSHG